MNEESESDIIEEKPLTLWEVIDILEKRKHGEHWETTDQRRTYEYAMKMVKLSKEDAENLLNILMEKFKIPRIIAVQMVNILPVTLDELDPFLKQLDEIGVKLEEEKREKFIRELLEVLRDYWKKARKIIEEEGETT